jgi:ribosomal-protein-alanine N-acetyltransferase
MIQTKRLNIKPLTYDQMAKYVKADNSLEAELNVNKTTNIIVPKLKDALENTIFPNLADPKKNYLFSTLWTMIDTDLNEMVGDLCFVGQPNEQGEVEIGYGSYEAFRGKGYMVEAVGGMVGWAKTQAQVNAIIASTDKTNVASYTILQKNGFVKTGENDSLFHWRLEFI